MSSSGDIEHPNDERIQNPGEGEEVFDPEENTGQEGEDDPVEDNSIPANMRDYLKGKLHVCSLFRDYEFRKPLGRMMIKRSRILRATVERRDELVNRKKKKSCTFFTTLWFELLES